jgi:hypothetical protein
MSCPQVKGHVLQSQRITVEVKGVKYSEMKFMMDALLIYT